MTAVLMTPPYLQFFDTDGVTPLNGGKVYTYTSTGGTFATAKATYTTAAATVEAANPVILNSRGIPTSGNGGLWLSGTYDFKVTDSAGVQVGQQLAVTAFTTLSASSTAYFESFSGTGSQTAFTTSSSLGTDEKAIYVWVNSGITNVVTNGTFATDTGWTKGAGWTLAAGVATATGAISTAISQTAAITLVEGQAYRITYTITRSAGDIIPSIGGTNGTTRSLSGTYNEVIIAGSSQTIAFTGVGFTGTLDTININVASPAGYEIQNPSAYTISGTTLTFATAPVSGTNNIYVSAPSLLVGAASSSAADAAASAAAALASQTAAGAYAGQLIVTSTTSLAIATGSKVFTVASGLALSAGQFILVVSNSAPTTKYMWGQIASYSSTTLTVTVAAVVGSSTHADWTMYLTGERGATGATGSISDLSGVTAGTIAVLDKLIFDDVSAADVTRSATLQSILNLTYANAAGTLAIANGGTGLATLTANNLLIGNGTSNVSFIAPSTSGNLLSSDGTNWASVTLASLLNQTLATIGSVRLGPAGGLIIKWGRTIDTNASGTVTFASAFPTSCYAVIACSEGGGARALSPATPSASAFTWTNAGAGQTAVAWVAFGV